MVDYNQYTILRAHDNILHMDIHAHGLYNGCGKGMAMNKTYVGEGSVVLLSGGGKIYTDMAARFVRSEKALEEIVASPYSRDLVRRILSSGHKAAVEFDFFLFGVAGYSRVTEAQLVRKRHASFMIKSGRSDKEQRSYDVVIPRSIEQNVVKVPVLAELVTDSEGNLVAARSPLWLEIGAEELLQMSEAWYENGVTNGLPEEELRYLKPQATEFKGLIGMNAHALLDWFTIRCCRNAQSEIRDMAYKMLKLCKEAAPDLFADAGPNCKMLGYCPENSQQNARCKGHIVTKDEALRVLAAHRVR